MRTCARICTNSFCLLTASALAAPPPSPVDWPQYNYDNRGWRFITAERALA